ncbi:hypothetical protein, partial [Pseudomonas umsongensis]|uniref:hypothetical protein n=1 Tax=Pseudomonas umsongensis TaxID=198618 RepID=UPI00200AA55D
QSIVKADFSELSSPTSKPYSGQHGFKSNIWPIVSTLQKSHEDVASDRRVESKTIEAYKVLPEEISSIVKSLSRHQITVNLLLVGAMLLNTTALILTLLPTPIIENTTGIIVNIISQIIISIFVLFWRQKT